MKIRNLIKALSEQGPAKRFFRNFFITRNAWGMFSKWSHYRKKEDGTIVEKVMYSNKRSGERAAASMKKKYDKHFSTYKCIFCDGYHIGRNRSNK